MRYPVVTLQPRGLGAYDTVSQTRRVAVLFENFQEYVGWPLDAPTKSMANAITWPKYAWEPCPTSPPASAGTSTPSGARR